MVIHHVKPFTRHFVHAVNIDRFQKLRFDKRHRVGPAIGLSRSGVNDTRIAILVLARLEDRQRRDRVHLQIFERLLHRLDVTDVSGEIEYVCFPANEPADEVEVAAIAFDDLDIVLDRGRC